MKILILVASVSLVMAFPKGSSSDGFEQHFGADEYCVDKVSKNLSTEIIFAHLARGIMESCQNDLVKPIDLPISHEDAISFSFPSCKKDAPEYCKDAVEELKGYCFDLVEDPNINDYCRTEKIKAFVERCLKN